MFSLTTICDNKYNIVIDNGGKTFTINKVDMTNGEWARSPYCKNPRLTAFLASAISSVLAESNKVEMNYRTLDMKEIYSIFNGLLDLINFAKTLNPNVEIPQPSEEFGNALVDGIENNVNSFNIIQKAVLYTVAGHPKASFNWIFDKSDQSVKIYEKTYEDYVMPDFVSEEVKQIVAENFYGATKQFWTYQVPFKVLLKNQSKKNIKEILEASEEVIYEKLKLMQESAGLNLDHTVLTQMLKNWYENNKVKRVVSTADVAQYVQQGGIKCPYCEGEDMENGEVELTDAGIITMNISCKDCGKTWTEEYTLSNIRLE
jgi:hypothetical protein